MARISKAELQRRADAEARVQKAHSVIMEQVSRLLTKHLPVLAGERTHSTCQIAIDIADGNAAIKFSYNTEITDHAKFTLDDGQKDLPLA